MPSNILSSNNFTNTTELKQSSYSNSPAEPLEKSDSTQLSEKLAAKLAVEQAKEIKKAEQLANEQKDVINQDELNEAIEVVSAFINQPPRNVNFIQDDDSGITVIKVFDNSSKELIKQFPSEELVSIAQKIKALHQQVGEQAGIFLDTSV